jgi:sugar lactone lactonase YvrE
MKMQLKAVALLLLAGMVSCTPSQDNPAPQPEPSPAPVPDNPSAYPSVMVTTVAGKYRAEDGKDLVDGKGTAARFKYPGQMVFDKFENLYIIDQGVFSEEATTIRKMDPIGNVTTFATGFGSLTDICIDPRDGVTLYGVDNTFRENDHGGIYRIDANGEKTRLGGGLERQGYQDGPLAEAKFYRPSGCVMDKSGNLYIADSWNFCVRKINLNSGMVTTLAGHPFDINTTTCRYTDGKGAAAEFCNFADLTIDGQGNIVVPDRYNNRIRKITPNGQVTTFIESGGYLELDGPLAEATAQLPIRTHYDPRSKILYMASSSGGRLRIATPSGHVFSVAGASGSGFGHGYQDGDGKTAKFNGIHGLAVNKKGEIFIADNVNYCIRKVTLTWQ